MKLMREVSAAADLDGLLAATRPKLHRFCARMVGSVIDGEDVLQDALIKAVESFASGGPIGNPGGWLVKMAHKTHPDYLRPRHRQQDPHERQGRSCKISRKLFESRRLASGAGAGGRAPCDPGIRSRGTGL